MEIITKEGKELESILESFEEEYQLTKDNYYYKSSEKKGGLFSKSTLEVRFYLKEELNKYIKESLSELLTNMGLEVNIEIKQVEGSTRFKIYSDNNSILIGKGGNTLKSLETIIKQRINTEFGIYPFIALDVENYRENQEGRLVRLAKRVAKDVVKTKTEAHLENMNAYERRIVHNALTDFKGIKTTSVGEEPERHIIIKPE